MTRILGAAIPSTVIAGLDPAIPYKLRYWLRCVDTRVKPAHDDGHGSVLTVDPDARRRKIRPDTFRRLRLDAAVRLRNRRHRRIGELHERRARQHQLEGLIQEPQTRVQWLGEQRQARYHRRCRLA